ncbi:MAG TPA: RNA methyltransferase [Azospirillaceae bacterium]|nr:RNA methyltransferase [Azospirillaceae bacterium]
MAKPLHPRPRKPAPFPAQAAVSPPADKPLKIAGLAAVAALFERDPGRVERLFFDERLKPKMGEFCKRLAAERKPYRLVAPDELARVAGTPMHGGVVAVTRPRALGVFDAEDARLWAAAHRPLLVLDGVGNPHNLGAIVRTMAFFGLEKLVISDHSAQAAPSEASYRVAEGGMEWVEISRAAHLPTALKRIKPFYRVVGTALGQGRPLDQMPADRPIALVLGNEEEGIPATTLAACEDVVTLPGFGRVQSLNVAATAAILAFEMTRTRMRGGA